MTLHEDECFKIETAIKGNIPIILDPTRDSNGAVAREPTLYLDNPLLLCQTLCLQFRSFYDSHVYSIV